MKLKRNNNAVSSAISLVLVLMLFFSSMAAIFFWGLPSIERMKAEVQSQSVASGLDTIDETLNRLLSISPDATRTKDIVIDLSLIHI